MTCVYDNKTKATHDCAECGVGLCSSCGYVGEASELHYCNDCYHALIDSAHEAA
jgi:hypothetical protein